MSVNFLPVFDSIPSSPQCTCGTKYNCIQQLTCIHIRWHSDLCADLGRRGPDRVDKIKLFNLPSNFQKIRLRPPSPDKKRLFFEDLPENNSDPHMLHMSS